MSHNGNQPGQRQGPFSSYNPYGLAGPYSPHVAFQAEKWHQQQELLRQQKAAATSAKLALEQRRQEEEAAKVAQVEHQNEVEAAKLNELRRQEAIKVAALRRQNPAAQWEKIRQQQEADAKLASHIAVAETSVSVNGPISPKKPVNIPQQVKIGGRIPIRHKKGVRYDYYEDGQCKKITDMEKYKRIGAIQKLIKSLNEMAWKKVNGDPRETLAGGQVVYTLQRKQDKQNTCWRYARVEE